MTSTPPRFKHLSEAIKNLKQQTRPFEKIILNIPKEYKRFPGEYQLPEEVLNDEKIYVNYVDVDLGPITKILPVKDLEFINDMDVCMAAADLVICRAGAITLSEIQALGKPAILIPSPNVAENHQYHNAMALVNAGAADIHT